MHIFVSGVAGFIGFHFARRLLQAGFPVCGLDNLNDYYDPQLKKDRLEQLRPFSEFTFIHGDLADSELLFPLFSRSGFTHAVNLAAQAGVRYSLLNPASYLQSNLLGFGHLLEACRQSRISHLLFASSSSVYGLNRHLPYSVLDNVDHPASLYAATKKSNELMAHAYSHLYALPVTGLRFFTAYGPWGRPDMAMHIFTKAILSGQALPVFNYGTLSRDFTYIDDIVESMFRLLSLIPQPDRLWNPQNPIPSASSAPYVLYNVGNHQPTPILDLIALLEDLLERKAVVDFLPMQPGDVEATYADTCSLQEAVGFVPSTPLSFGVQAFLSWFRGYYHL